MTTNREDIERWLKDFVLLGHHDDVDCNEQVSCAYCGMLELWDSGECQGINHEDTCTLIQAQKYLDE